jgi:hypothetical protein
LRRGCSADRAAVVPVRATDGFCFTDPGGGYEYPPFGTVAPGALAWLGDGAFAPRPGSARRIAG